MRHHTFGFVALAIALSPAAAIAQEWRRESVIEAGIEIDAPSRLERLPMQLGEDSMYHRARLRPKDPADFIQAQYYWQCDVYEFSSSDDPAKDGVAGRGIATTSPFAGEDISPFARATGGRLDRPTAEAGAITSCGQ